MVEIKILDKIKEVCPNIVLGCIQASVKVESSSENLLKEIDEYCEELSKKMSLEDISSLPRIKDAREVYKKLGKAPSKYRVSSEALMRRILQKKGIYKINNIVEINNLISLKSNFSVGSYNVRNIQSPIYLTVGAKGEKYKGIGKELINIENLPVLSDSISTFGSPTSDSERAMITNDVNEIIMCVYSFSGKDEVDIYLNYAKELLEKYGDAKNISIKVIE
ncbi:tRNA-binding protein [[Clostridium] sordellii]|uniref:B3/B4 domain-containing protein n=1 Tax=Paraclostridium sordellii TaxID=1505 RepID=UPI0005DDFA83|nr:phenylalanine--tRNA ligase beta subunit-related protein [Paeniclostridium sordellii]CEQ11347.1 tRNA-binding protein [[Clostridium] sordellii] [Paeniclostridium sordellii]